MKSQILLILIASILFGLSINYELIVINNFPNKTPLSCDNTKEGIEECTNALPAHHTKVCVLDSKGNGKCLWHDNGKNFHPAMKRKDLRNLSSVRNLMCDLSSDCSEGNVNVAGSCYFGLGTCQYCITIDLPATCSDVPIGEQLEYCCYVE